MKPRPPFKTELPPAHLVRDYTAATGADPHAYAEALLETAVRILTGDSQDIPATSHASLRAMAENALALFPVSRREGVAGALTPEWLGELHRLARADGDHKRHGRWYTPRPVARFMARRALAAASLCCSMDTVRILDPACGCGALTVPMLEEVVAFRRALRPEWPIADLVADALRHIVLVDLDARAIEIARLRLRIAAEELSAGGVSSESLRPPNSLLVNALTAPPEMIAPGGVDVVIMNPPYLGARYYEALENPDAARAELRREYGWNDDLYAHFLHRAWEWLRPGGAVCAITSDTFLTIPSKARTRDTLRRHAFREIVRVPSSAFSASVHTCVTVAVRAEPELFDHVTYIDARAAPEEAWGHLEAVPPPDGAARYEVPAQVYADPEAPFFLPTPRAVALYSRYWQPSPEEAEHFVPLGEVAPARDVGINSGNVRHRLFFAEHRPGLRRLIQGRQLVRYAVQWDSPAARFRWVDTEYQPNPTERGIGRGGRVSSRGESWGFRGPLEIHHSTERLFLRQTEDDLFAAYLRQDPADPIYTDNTLFTLLLTERARELGLSYPYLLGILNSAFLNELYHVLSQEQGRSQAQVKVGCVNRLPIALGTPESRRAIEVAAEEAMRAAADGKPTTAHQWRLDTLVEQLYAPPQGDCIST